MLLMPVSLLPSCLFHAALAFGAFLLQLHLGPACLLGNSGAFLFLFLLPFPLFLILFFPSLLLLLPTFLFLKASLALLLLLLRTLCVSLCLDQVRHRIEEHEVTLGLTVHVHRLQERLMQHYPLIPLLRVHGADTGLLQRGNEVRQGRGHHTCLSNLRHRLLLTVREIEPFTLRLSGVSSVESLRYCTTKNVDFRDIFYQQELVVSESELNAIETMNRMHGSILKVNFERKILVLPQERHQQHESDEIAAVCTQQRDAVNP
mmetsp:Transcript_3375/g.9685  ORF Transcript_3375/g.9685 Transcript_3375/m.9685 type:complete len:261 (+) Transcript_3375:504-1286(+)